MLICISGLNLVSVVSRVPICFDFGGFENKVTGSPLIVGAVDYKRLFL
ncbi:unnamed protein product [Arabidopsis halleri]